ncbi:MAG TPA: DUF47 family protein [Bacteroidales bacterium]|nr:DUF47 family protein [Bacteroidales bacterium]
MLRGILPKEYAFYDFFERLMSVNIAISNEFMATVEEKKDLEITAKVIKTYEREADNITKDCVDLLHRTFITPIDRDQIYELVIGMDDFADHMNAATFRLAYYGVEEMRQDMIEIGKIIHNCITELDEAVKGLRKIKKHSVMIRQKCHRIHELENLADDVSRIAIANLFKTNDHMLILKWKEIFERLEKAVDRTERVANSIESILIDNA